MINVKDNVRIRFFLASIFYFGMLVLATIAYGFNYIAGILESIGNKIAGGHLVAE